MVKTRSTKRALLMSGLALLMCISMLIGSTFAWFTDSVTSAGNIIKSGTLDVTMEWADGTKAVPADDSTDWIDASAGAIFDYDLWEPGFTQVRHIKIANEGNLALKYQLNIIANGVVSKLADVIDVYYVDPAIQVADRAALANAPKLGTLNEVLANISTSASGELLAGEKDTVTLALKMQESAGNEYQNLAIGSDFSVQLMATQLTYEKDSFNDQYDVKATYLNQDADGAWLINNMDELFFFASDVNSGNTYNGETVKLTADIDLTGYNWVPIGRIGKTSTDFTYSFRGTFDGQEHTISNVNVSDEGWAGVFGIAYRPAVIKNLKVDGATLKSSRMTGTIVGQIYGSIENCHVEDATITVVPNLVGDTYDNGDKVGGIVGWLGDNGNNHYIKNCSAKNVTLKAYRDVAGIAGYISNSSTVENCSVDTISVTIDQATNHYGVKDANAGGVVGRINSPATVQNNTENNVTLDIPKFVSTAAQLQDALDAAKTGDTIYLTKGVDYGIVYMGRSTKNNDTEMFCETHSYTTKNAAEFVAHLAETGYHTTPRYTTTLKNLTIVGAEGATISGLKASSGHFYGDVYDYVRDIDFNVGSAYYNTLNIENVLFSKVNFTGKVDINTSDATSIFDGITFDECTFTTGGTDSGNGAALRYYNEANNGNVKNIVVKNCTFTNSYQGVYVHHVNGVSVIDSKFDTTGHNAIAIQSTSTPVNLKNVVITKNSFNNIGDRVIRFGAIGADSNITIQENTATNSGDEDGEVMRAVSIESGITTSISNNNWNGVVANDELKDNT